MRYPHIFAYNRPSNLLAAWMKLREAGIPEENIRFLPIAGSASLPEVTIEPGQEGVEPGEEERDNPLKWRPRIQVNVGSQRRTELVSNGQEATEKPNTVEMGRLARFLTPLLEG